MTTRPRFIPLGRYLLPGFIALALFGLFASTFLVAEFPDPLGLPDSGIVGAIGYALIGAAEHSAVPDTENFLVGLILIAILLDAALDGSLMLAKRDEGGDGK